MLRLPFLEAPGHSAEGGQDGGRRGRGETASERERLLLTLTFTI